MIDVNAEHPRYVYIMGRLLFLPSYDSGANHLLNIRVCTSYYSQYQSETNRTHVCSAANAHMKSGNSKRITRHPD